MADNDESIVHPRIAPKVNPNPLQRPGADRLLRRATTCGPDQPGDRSFVIDAKTLRHMLDIAQSSPAQQVIIPVCGVQVDLYERARDGHTYEIWRIIGGQPRPSRLPAAVEALIHNGFGGQAGIRGDGQQ